MNNYIDKTNMIGLGMVCDSCGRTVQGITYINGMKFCAKCYQETFGKQEDFKTAHYTEHLEQENAQLKQQLAEKDKEAETYKREIVFLDKKIKDLKEEIEDIKEIYSEKLKDKITVKCVGATDNFKNQFRHEICEKIRNFVNEYCRYDYDLMGWHLTEEKLENLLEEIKRGK